MIAVTCCERRTVNQLTALLLTLSASALLCSTLNASPYDNTLLLQLGKRFCDDFTHSNRNAVSAIATTAAEDILQQRVTSEQNDIVIRGRRMGLKITLHTQDAQVLEVQFITPPARPPRTVLTDFNTLQRFSDNKPSTQLILDADCRLTQAQQISYTPATTPAFIQPLASTDDNTLVASGDLNWINPPLPALPVITPPRLRVGMVDSGVNYQLPAIANALARDESGNLIGYDYWDNDNSPYDANPARSPYFVQRHGTRTASIVIAEAPGVALVPYRYPRVDMSRMKALVEHAAAHNIRIIGMPLGSNDYKTWVDFETAAINHPDILFIVSAGNNGRNIDINGVYPAAMDIPNMIVVTSANDFVQPAERTNFGPLSVDYLVPAEDIEALDYNGSKVRVSGSSYAVSRVVALAARILGRDPQQSTAELSQQIKKLSVRANTAKYVTTGFLGDPLVSPAPILVSDAYETRRHTTDTSYSLPLSINILDQRWLNADISVALADLNKIFKQCSITATIEQWQIIHAPDYLADLSTGHALTLHRKTDKKALTIYFANDTRMQPQFDAEAFGEGNTGNRPWMKNTLWMTYGIRDTGIALAHELYHIIANDGTHVTTNNNLMHQQTADSHTRLSDEQCSAAIKNGLAKNLLHKQN